MRFKKNLIQLLLTSSVLYGEYAFCGQPVFDVSNYERAFEILKAAKEQAEQLKQVHGEISQTKSLLGQFREDKEYLRNELLSWRTYYDKIDTLDAHNFSAFGWLGVDKLHPSNYASSTTNYIGGGFNAKQAFDNVKLQMFDDQKHPEEMQYRRQELAHNSMTTSVVVSNESKRNLKDAKKRILDVTGKSLGASDLLNTLKAQNELLGVIASEMVQQRELQAQQLELLASFFAKFEGTGKLTNPSKRTVKKNVWD